MQFTFVFSKWLLNRTNPRKMTSNILLKDLFWYQMNKQHFLINSFGSVSLENSSEKKGKKHFS